MRIHDFQKVALLPIFWFIVIRATSHPFIQQLLTSTYLELDVVQENTQDAAKKQTHGKDAEKDMGNLQQQIQSMII